MEALLHPHGIINAIIYSIIGIVILVISFYTIEKLTPENLYKKVVEENNIAIAIVVSAFIIAIAVIVSSAIRG